MSGWRKFSFFSTSVGIILILGFALFLLNIEYFLTYLQLPSPGGLDTPAHADVGLYYAEYIFPSVWGWAPQWFSGLPFPQFYPPLFYILLALLHILLPFSYTAILKGFLLTLTLLLPGLLALLARKISGSVSAAYLSGIASVCLLSTFGPYANIGVNLYSTFNVGLVTHLLGFVLFIVWFIFFLDFNFTKSNRAQTCSIVTLTLVLLSSVHVVPLVAITYTVLALIECIHAVRVKNMTSFFMWAVLHLRALLVSFALAAFWYVPLLFHYGYFNTRALGIETGIAAEGIGVFLKNWGGIMVIPAVALYVALTKSFSTNPAQAKQGALIVSFIALAALVPSLVRFDLLLPSLPMGTYRLLTGFYMLSPVLAGFVYASSQTIRSIPIRTLIFLLLLLPFVFGYATYAPHTSNRGFYTTYKTERVEDIIQYPNLKENPGLIHVESYTSGRPLSYFLTKDPTRRLSTTYIVFVEPTLSSTFFIPLRHSMSYGREPVPIMAHLMNDRTFMEQSLDTHIEQAKFLGISYFLISSPEQLDRFRKNKNVRLEKDFGTWSLFSLKDAPSTAEVLTYKPTLLFAPLLLKARRVDTYDYLRFQEEILYHRLFDVTLVRPNNENLDTSPDLDRFSSALITEYTYKNFDKAYERLKNYSLQNKLFLVSDNDPLFKKLSELPPSHNIKIFKRQRPLPTDIMPMRKQIAEILTVLEKQKEIVPNTPEKKNLPRTDNEKIITITMPGNVSGEPVPILIKSSYFPAWKQTTSKEPAYLTTPSFMLTFASTSVSLAFTTPQSIFFGWGITILGILYLIYQTSKPRIGRV